MKIQFQSTSQLLKIGLFLLGNLIFSFTGSAQVEHIRDRLLHSNELLIAAHRAAHSTHPENSLNAIQEAIDLGVDIIEIDVRVTADGEVFLMHDQTINRTTTGIGDIEILTSKDIDQVRLLYNGEETSQQVPTLKEALHLSKGKIMVDLDLKTSNINAVLAVVKELDMFDEVIFFDSDWKVLQEIKSQYPDAYLMPRTYKKQQVKKAYKKLDPVIIHIDPNFNTKEVNGLAKKYGFRTWINSLGELDQKLAKDPQVKYALDLISNGANVVQTDLPEFWLMIKKQTSSSSIN
ncbi:glycerophosphodiester phosphodiesterase family protein [Algoriphagus halophilus]|uniref:Glycerophosphoryl diester phosphodiesterase n=1 Tax=Algoriphagus halophilus TaxID=226505 RepID=A0A1N6DRY3_9BACT|nr:glycerophosphodiester phosphodiesterase family protein [Algoriphagus halophilus]SIN73453.1 glycerophosphoryl diester phosphodiesterase [Algoriphagus halophilus]